MILHHSVVSTHQSYIWSIISKSFDLPAPDKQKRYIYLSRSGLTKDKRRLSNELELEDALGAIGVAVIHPETLTFEQQIAIYANADVVIGPSGSALHNAAFMKKGSRIISLSTRDFCLLNELLCCYASQVSYTLFICEGESKEHWSVPIEKLLQHLNDTIMNAT